MAFSEEEINHLREIFELFDREKMGSISIKDLEAIMQSLNRDPEEAKPGRVSRYVRDLRFRPALDSEGEPIEAAYESTFLLLPL